MRRGSVVVAAAVLASACSHPATPLQTVRRASALTAAAGTARQAVTVSGGSVGSLSFEGVIDFTNKAVDVTGTASQAPKSETIVVGDAVYTLVGGTGVGGKPWIKLSRSGVDAGGARSAGLPARQDSADPTPVLAALGAATAVSKVGPDTVRGVAVTHFSATLGPGTAVGPAQAQVWVDGQGRIRRLSVGSGSSGTVTTTTEWYDFGTAVHIAAPPPDQVADVQSLLNQAAQPTG